MSNSPRETRGQAKGPEPDGTEGHKSADTGVSVKGGDTNNQKQAAKQAAAQPTDKRVPSREMISDRLKELVMGHLQNMYGATKMGLDEDLKAQIDRGVVMAGKLVDMGCGPEVAKDLTALTLYDVAILIGMFWG